MYQVKVLEHSISDLMVELVTFEVTMPRFVLAEFNTHRMFSRNSASSRAIPLSKQIERLQINPFIPIHWGAAQKGMQAFKECNEPLSLPQETHGKLQNLRYDGSREDAWTSLMDQSIEIVQCYEDAGYHKQIPARLLEPWMWHTVIVSSTEWNNYFSLRCPDENSETFNNISLYDPCFPAQPEIQKAAFLMLKAYEKSSPRQLKEGEWHLPLYGLEFEDDYKKDYKTEIALPQGFTFPLPVVVSAGRCARVSYLTHEGKRDVQEDIKLGVEKLSTGGHWSPWEHQATPMERTEWHTRKALADMYKNSVDTGVINPPANGLEDQFMFSGNFRGWHQARKYFPNESGRIPRLQL